MKILIGFTSKTGKVLPRIFCRKFRHCAIIIWPKEQSTEHKYILYHIASGRVHGLELRARDLQTLSANGWVFIRQKVGHRAEGIRQSVAGVHDQNTNLGNKEPALCLMPYALPALSCVTFVKRAIGLYAPFVWTPLQLYKKLLTLYPGGVYDVFVQPKQKEFVMAKCKNPKCTCKNCTCGDKCTCGKECKCSKCK